jgi:sugar phosphate isomerase/epimerase
MQLQLGVNTCFAVKRWPRPEDWGPIVRDRLELGLVQHSLDLVDIGAGPPMLESQSAAICKAVADHGIQLHSTFTGLAAYSENLLLGPDQEQRAAAMAWYRAAIGFTKAIGGKATGGHVGCFSVPDWRDPTRRAALWQGLKASLAELSSEAKAAGLDHLMVENLAVAREPSTMDMVNELLDDGDDQRVPIRLCLDIGHMCVPGTTGPDRDPYAWLASLGRSASVVQLQQSDPEGDHHWPFTDGYNAVGRITADKVIEALAKAGVDKTALVLEVIPPFEREDDAVLDDMAASVDYWREALSRHGVLAG